MTKCLFRIVFTSGILFACKKDGPPPQPPVIAAPGPLSVYIVNEGGFQAGNSSVSHYQEGQEAAAADVFHNTNTRPLGDVCQSMQIDKNLGYLVVNNSAKVEVVELPSFKLKATISGFRSPRYILPVNSKKAYVTDLYASAISVVDLGSNTITGSVTCGAWTEELALVNNEAFVSCHSRDQVYVISTYNDQLSDSIKVTKGGNSIVTDKEGKLWVLCSGDAAAGIKAALYRIDPVTHQIDRSFTFENQTESPWRLVINGSKDTLYYLNEGVCRMPINSEKLPAAAHIAREQRQLYGLGVNPLNGRIYVSDAIDYVQRGKVYVYEPDGRLFKSFLVGIIPGDFCFP